MTDAQINLASSFLPKLRILSRLLGAFSRGGHTHPPLDLQAMPDYLRRDIGLAPAELALDHDIKMMNVNIRAGIILPRPC